MHDYKIIEKNVNKVVKAMLKKFINPSYTIQILLWDDGTSSIVCRHCDDEEVLHLFTFYKNKLSYEQMPVKPETVMTVDEFGNEQFWGLVELK